jgi:hypothetical protein
MNPRGAVFQPELIELMRSVLEDVMAMLAEAKCTSSIKAETASQILAYAAKGERDAMALKSAGLQAVVDVPTIRAIFRRSVRPSERARSRGTSSVGVRYPRAPVLGK